MYDTVLGGKAYKLNVTSLKWLDMDHYKISSGGIGDHSVWKHEVIVIEHRKVKSRNTTLLYLASATAGCQDDHITNPFQNVDTAFGDVLAHESELITIVAFQVPNCKMIFADDP